MILWKTWKQRMQETFKNLKQLKKPKSLAHGPIMEYLLNETD